MTEAPKIGFLCTGKTPLELAVSIHCQSKMSPVLTEAGYAVGGCYTEIFDGSGPEKIKRPEKRLNISAAPTMRCSHSAVRAFRPVM